MIESCRSFRFAATALGAVVAAFLLATPARAEAPAGAYAALLQLFADWRTFERPALDAAGVPDFRPPAIAAKATGLAAMRARLAAIPTAGLTPAEQVDHRLVEAEMNGLDFDLRVLTPWARDPSFYANVYAEQSDTPSHEGAAARPAIDLWTYAWPLSKADEARLARELGIVPPLLAQARQNLKDGNARELWKYGSRAFHEQAEALAALARGTLTLRSTAGTWTASTRTAGAALKEAVERARQASAAFATWVEGEAPSKTGPSGVGREQYDWYLAHVHLVPYTWHDEVVLLTRELERAQAALALEEHHNRDLPPLEPAPDAAAFRALCERRVDELVDFLVRRGAVLAPRPTLRATIAAQIQEYAPPGHRNFFQQVTAREPTLLYTHQYHWLDLVRMRDEPQPSPVRRGPPLYNIWDSRAEGFATAFEEIAMHAGLYDANPRARELVWIMLANRAARGLASLHSQANEFTLQEAGEFAARHTPRGWAPADSDLTGFEQLLYLRQPGYGSSYVTGKLLADRLIADWVRASPGKPFDLRAFMERFNATGLIPVSQIDAELTRP
ncbi:MAG: DUF885 domain-containing protein [Proteobacteria bacterium]|nr:DUF885 domain-containing protein [Pseudomonadota bacterium]